MVQVKICGVTRLEDARAAIAAGADFAGLVFHRASPRHVQPDQANSLAAQLRGRMRVVAVLADATDSAVAQAVSAADPDFLQLHGGETPERAAFIRARFGKPVIKALAIAGETDFARLAAYDDVADMLLFDAKGPAGAVRGGHGRAFDWQLLRTRTIRKPWLLGGGLDCGNVARAIATAGAPGVDVSSGVEKAPGVKSAEAISAFVAAARAAELERVSPS
ncbi:MAG TPA: phosphoribosylanthranilate isomerase [Rhizomicrobium sp.]|jgi:phosphoribosylanthranilate isomerase